jgi:predicted KAP-like P-loop ATPase
MIATDAPITARSEDQLERAPFARALATSILNFNGEDSFVIGVHGKWGSGKSSVLNLCVEELNALPTQKGVTVDVLRFNPWYFSDQGHLMLQFFRQFTSHLRRAESAGMAKLKELVSTLDEYSESLSPALQAVPHVGGLFKPAQKMLSFATKKFGMGNDIDSLHDTLTKQLLQLKRKIVVVIDDIDRLTAPEIRQVFQVVKLSARFPYVVYLLAFDRHAVVEALKNDGLESGEEYLEKIVQVSFDLPSIEQSSLTTFITSGIDDVLGRYPPAKFDMHCFGNMFHAGFLRSFTSVRDVRRFMNGLEFAFSLIGAEVNGVDLIALEAIRLFHPAVYEIVRNSEDVLAGPVDSSDSTYEKYKARVERLFESVKPKYEAVRDLLIELFPRLQYAYANTVFNSASERRWEADLRIASRRYFGLYFRLAVPATDVSFPDVQMTLSLSDDLPGLERKLEEYRHSKRLVNALSAIRACMPQVPKQNLKNWLIALINISDLMQGRNGMFSLPDYWQGLFAISDVLELLQQIERFQILQDVYQVASGLGTMATLIEICEEDRQKNTNKFPDYTDAVGDGLKQIVVDRVRRVAQLQPDAILSSPMMSTILNGWGKWADMAEPQSFVEKVLLNWDSLADFVNHFITPVQASGWSDRVSRTFNHLSTRAIAQWVNCRDLLRALQLIDRTKISDSRREAVAFVIAELERMEREKLTPEEFDSPIRAAMSRA